MATEDFVTGAATVMSKVVVEDIMKLVRIARATGIQREDLEDTLRVTVDTAIDKYYGEDTCAQPSTQSS